MPVSLTRRVTWAYRVNADGIRLGGYCGVVMRWSALGGVWKWRERFRCDHIHTTTKEARACAEEVKGL